MKKVIGALAFLVYCCALLELASFVYFRFGFGRLSHAPVYARPADDAGTISVFDWYTHTQQWGAWHLPNALVAHTNWCYDARYRSNSYGARDIERPISGRDRAVFIGDSFVEGYTVNDADRMTNILEAHYGVPVLNFGTGGHAGPLQYEILYRELARRFEHGFVFVGILPDNDFSDNDQAAWKGLPEYRRLYRPYYSADGKSAVYALAQPPALNRVVQTPGRMALELARRYTWTFGLLKEVRRVVLERQHRGEAQSGSYSGYRDATAEQLQNVIGSLRRIAVMAQEDGRRMAVVLFPRPSDYALAEADVTIRKAFDELAATAGIIVVDLREQVPYEPDLYQKCDGHWSPMGNRAAAKAILDRIPVLWDDYAAQVGP